MQLRGLMPPLQAPADRRGGTQEQARLAAPLVPSSTYFLARRRACSDYGESPPGSARALTERNAPAPRSDGGGSTPRQYGERTKLAYRGRPARTEDRRSIDSTQDLSQFVNFGESVHALPP